jgi:hypothetical protein
LPDTTKPGKLNKEVAKLKCDAEGTPPPMDIWPADVVMMPPPAIVVEAMIVTGPATLPLFRITVAAPFTVDPTANVAPGVDPIYAPPPGPCMVNVTIVPSVTGLPFMSNTLNITVDVACCPDPFIPIICGVAETN